MDNFKCAFAFRLRTLREKKGISRKTLAELCGLSKDMVAKYERGECMPSLGTIFVLANALEVDFSKLF